MHNLDVSHDVSQNPTTVECLATRTFTSAQNPVSLGTYSDVDWAQRN